MKRKKTNEYKSFNSRTPGGVRPLFSESSGDNLRFQFTHPGRGATPKPGHDQDDTDVSIHAPREGCDGITLQAGNSAGKFQFTHPGRGAT